MITEELVAYVKEQRRAGVSDQAIREAILSVGWTEEDANQALSPTSPEPVAKTSPPSSEKEVPDNQEQTKATEKAVEQEKEEQRVVKDEFSSSPSGSEKIAPSDHPEEKTSPSEIPSLDSQSGPIELDDQARPITSSSTSQKQESPLKTEEDLAKPVSFTKQDQDQPKQESPQSSSEQAPSQPEPEPAETKPAQPKTAPQEANQPSSNQENTTKPAQVSKQEEKPQIAVDPKVEEK